MRNRILLVAALAALPLGCKSTDCGDGTTEQDGTCVPSSNQFSNAMCGPFTVLQGNQCVPMYPPTVCGDGTEPDTDADGVTTCIGTGAAAGCSAKIACPAPTDGKQTICGQIYNFETGDAYAASNATGAACTPAATGPCALGIQPFEALAFAANPTGTSPLASGAISIDDCGRYKVSEITLPSTPYIALGLDDSMRGPGGLTNAVGVATAATANTATKDLAIYVVPSALTTGWTSAGNGAPSISDGFYVGVYRGHRTGLDLATGVTASSGPTSNPYGTDANSDFYFASGATARTTLDNAATSTGVNGTALFKAKGAADITTTVYSGVGGLPATCFWDVHPGASTPGTVFIQDFRPMNAPGQTCSL